MAYKLLLRAQYIFAVMLAMMLGLLVLILAVGIKFTLGVMMNFFDYWRTRLFEYSLVLAARIALS